MNKSLQTIKYVFFDLVASLITWSYFFRYRKLNLEPSVFGFDEGAASFLEDENFVMGVILIPLCWILFYAFTGSYNDVFRKHRFKDISQTVIPTLIGCLIIFFVLILDDQIATYKSYYSAFFMLFAMQCGLTLLFRLITTSGMLRRMNRKQIGFNTLIVGGGDAAMTMYQEIDGMKKSPGYLFKGFVNLLEPPFPLKEAGMAHLGSFDEAEHLVGELGIEEVIIALDTREQEKMGHILNTLSGKGLKLKMIPDMYDIMSGSVRMTSIYGTPLIEIDEEIMPFWQRVTKRGIDIVVSLLALLILSPVYALIAMTVKNGSPGPAFFRQERIGLHNKPFFIHKFRTMYTDAESAGPQLSSTTDKRITTFGRWLRKTRLDELPQFWNVLKGEMSLVGPRPERQFYIDQIMERAPHYRHLQKVRPGITSWGQVKYGYAENVDEMIQRLKYDVLYIENMSLAVDFRILAYTVLTVLKGSGK